jgi:membrane associated rhomboid family serine protease
MKRARKILFWTLFMAIGTLLIIDRKVPSEDWQEHLLLGGVAGFLLGYFFSRRVRAKQAAAPKS